MTYTIKTKTYVLARDISITDDYETTPIDISEFRSYSVQVVISDCSVDCEYALNININNDDNEAAVALPDSVLPITTATTHFYYITAANYARASVNFTKVAGSFKVTIILSAKG